MAKVTQRLSPLTNPTGLAVQATAEPGATGPGFYQGIVGRKSGRPAPNPMGNGRTPRHEAIMAAHGLMDKGAADPNQGSLFAPSELPPLETPTQSAARTGTPPPLASSRPGFMPGLYEHKDKAGVVSTKTTAQAHRAMIGAVNRLPNFALDTPGPAPVAEALHQREVTRARHQGDAPWYASRTETTHEQQVQGAAKFELGPGSATEMITNASARHGITYEKMARAVAITSPRTRWTGGMEGTSDFEAPNLESAENVVRNVQGAMSEAKVTDRSVNYAEIGHASAGRSLGEMKAKAAMDYVHSDPSKAIPIGDLSSQKVPNFNQSLLQAHPAQSVRRQAALSYTVDTHDVSSQGSHVDLLKTPGGYAISHMIGRRAALRNRELPTMGQSGVWMGQKSKEPEPMGNHSLFVTSRSGQLRPNPSALPDHRPPASQGVDMRSETAKRMGLEF